MQVKCTSTSFFWNETKNVLNMHISYSLHSEKLNEIYKAISLVHCSYFKNMSNAPRIKRESHDHCQSAINGRHWRFDRSSNSQRLLSICKCMSKFLHLSVQPFWNNLKISVNLLISDLEKWKLRTDYFVNIQQHLFIYQNAFVCYKILIIGSIIGKYLTKLIWNMWRYIGFGIAVEFLLINVHWIASRSRINIKIDST